MGHSPFLVVVQARSDGPIGLRGFEVPVGIQGDVLNCCGKMPSLRRAGLPGSFNLPKQLRASSSPTSAGSVLSRRPTCSRTAASSGGSTEVLWSLLYQAETSVVTDSASGS